MSIKNNNNSNKKSNNNSKSKKKTTKSTLTIMQKSFTTEYLKDHNATQAALRAGYSPKTAYSQGQRLLKNVEIQKRITKAREKVMEGNIASAIEVEEFLSLAMRGLIKEEVVITEGYGPGESKAKIVEKGASLRDRLRASEMLARRYALFTERLEVSEKRENSILEDLSGRVGSKKELDQVDFEDEDLDNE